MLLLLQSFTSNLSMSYLRLLPFWMYVCVRARLHSLLVRKIKIDNDYAVVMQFIFIVMIVTIKQSVDAINYPRSYNVP